MTGSETRVKVVKNKVAPPFRQCEFDIIYNEGISKEGELVDIGAENGIIEKTGSWFSYGKERIGQGKDNARQFVRDTREIAAEIENRIREKVVLANQSPAREDEAEEATAEEEA